MPQSVASFDPKLIEALRVGSRQTLRIPLATYGQAHRLRFRLHSLLAALRRESSPLVIVTEKVHIKISKKHELRAWLEIRPADSELAAAIAEALPGTQQVQTHIMSGEPSTDRETETLGTAISDVIGKAE